MALLPLGVMTLVYAAYGTVRWVTLGDAAAAWEALATFLRSVPGASLFTAAAAVTAFWQGSRLSERAAGRLTCSTPAAYRFRTVSSTTGRPFLDAAKTRSHR